MNDRAVNTLPEEDDDINFFMEDSIHHKSKFAEWKADYVKNLQGGGSGVHVNGNALLREWNLYQKKQALLNQAKKRADAKKKRLIARVDRDAELLRSMGMEQYAEVAAQNVDRALTLSEEEEFNAMDKQMLQLQETLNRQKATAIRQQQELFAASLQADNSLSPEQLARIRQLPSPEDSYKLQSDDIGPIEGEI